MAQVRKLVRDSIRNILAASETGFNARLNAIQSAYGIADDFTIDFGDGSTSFLQIATPPDGQDMEFLSIVPKPIGLFLYTQQARSERGQNSPNFSGSVEARLDFYLRFSDTKSRSGIDRIEQGNTEDLLDAIEEAAMLALHDVAAAWAPGLIYGAQFGTERGTILPLGDGFIQRTSLLYVIGVEL